MYTQDMLDSIKRLEETRPNRIGKEFPRLTPDEKAKLLQDYHPDYKKGTTTKLRVGYNKGETTVNELAEMLEVMSDTLGRPPLIFCEGVDKYRFSGGEIHLLSPTLSIISKSMGKLLYELNLLYTVNLDFEWQKQDATMMILTSSDETKIRKMLQRRAGIYSSYRESVFEILAKLSGGNPRAAPTREPEGREDSYEWLLMSGGRMTTSLRLILVPKHKDG